MDEEMMGGEDLEMELEFQEKFAMGMDLGMTTDPVDVVLANELPAKIKKAKMLPMINVTQVIGDEF
jgi:hypothetical protein